MNKGLVKELMKAPNLITLFRLLSVPVLWVLALMDYSRVLGIGYILAALTDSADGYVARRMNLASEFGSKFDSLADHILGPSAIAWLVILESSVFTDNAVIFLIALSFYLLRMIVAWLKFNRLANMHLYSGKFYGGVLFVFIAHSLLVEGYSQPFFYFMVSVLILSMIEGLILMLTHDQVNEHMKSIYHVYMKRRSGIESGG